MAINISSSSNFTPAPAGSHVARCFRVLDLGTHDENWQGNVNSNRKILLQFELPNEKHVFHEERGEEPFTVQREFTASLGKKANLRAFLEGWRGRSFTDEELKKFDIAALAGKACLVNVIHKESNGKTYANIQSAMVLPKGMVCPSAINPIVTFSLEENEFDEAVLAALPEWLRNKIGESKEYKAICNDTPSSGEKSSGGSITDGLEDDDIPF